MDKQEYMNFYIDYVNCILLPAVKRESKCDTQLGKDIELQEHYQNYSLGLCIVSIISIIETNFLSRKDIELARKFKIGDINLSSFYYIRDCFSHNPNMGLFSKKQNNTKSFLHHISTGDFTFSTIVNDKIRISNESIKYLHDFTLKKFSEKGNS